MKTVNFVEDRRIGRADRFAIWWDRMPLGTRTLRYYLPLLIICVLLNFLLPLWAGMAVWLVEIAGLSFLSERTAKRAGYWKAKTETWMGATVALQMAMDTDQPPDQVVHALMQVIAGHDHDMDIPSVGCFDDTLPDQLKEDRDAPSA